MCDIRAYMWCVTEYMWYVTDYMCREYVWWWCSRIYFICDNIYMRYVTECLCREYVLCVALEYIGDKWQYISNVWKNVCVESMCDVSRIYVMCGIGVYMWYVTIHIKCVRECMCWEYVLCVALEYIGDMWQYISDVWQNVSVENMCDVSHSTHTFCHIWGGYDQ